MALIRIGGARDLRVDFFRGLALWWIFTDHVPGDILDHYSLHNYAMCDAAEMFVLLAGYAAGLAYGRTMDRQGYLYAAADVVRRAWTLYIAHIFLFVVFTAQVAYSASLLDRAYYLDEARLDILADSPYRALLEALLLRFQPNFLNILPLYVLLLLIFALALPLLRRPKLLLGCSLTLYLAVAVSGLNMQGWGDEDWYFDPFAWQFLFMIGAVLSYRPPPRPRVNWPLDVLSIAVLAFGLVVIFVINVHPVIPAAMPAWVVRWLISQDKTDLHPARLFSILALTWGVIRLVPFSARWLRSWFAAPFVLLGQNSLPVFCSGIFFGFMVRLGLEYRDDAWMQLVTNGFGAIAMLTVATLAAWYRGKGRAPGRQPATVPAVQAVTPAVVVVPMEAHSD